MFSSISSICGQTVVSTSSFPGTGLPQRISCNAPPDPRCNVEAPDQGCASTAYLCHALRAVTYGIFYDDEMLPQWKASALIGGLASKTLIRIVVTAATAKGAERWNVGHRIRDVEVGAD